MKTSELSGAALDWAVAKCEGVNDEVFRLYYTPTEPSDYDAHGYPEFHYSTIWAQGGAIIEREEISIVRVNSELWDAHMSNVNFYESGATPLIAAMRCYVAGKLGDEVEVPEELLSCAHA